MSWKKIPTSTIFNLKKLKKRDIDSHSSMLLYSKTSEWLWADFVWIKIHTADLRPCESLVFSYCRFGRTYYSQILGRLNPWR